MNTTLHAQIDSLVPKINNETAEDRWVDDVGDFDRLALLCSV